MIVKNLGDEIINVKQQRGRGGKLQIGSIIVVLFSTITPSNHPSSCVYYPPSFRRDMVAIVVVVAVVSIVETIRQCWSVVRW